MTMHKQQHRVIQAESQFQVISGCCVGFLERPQGPRGFFAGLRPGKLCPKRARQGPTITTVDWHRLGDEPCSSASFSCTLPDVPAFGWSH